MLTVTAGTANQIRANSIHDNANLGMISNGDGVTANDNLDPDTGPTIAEFPFHRDAETYEAGTA